MNTFLVEVQQTYSNRVAVVAESRAEAELLVVSGIGDWATPVPSEPRIVAVQALEPSTPLG